MQENQRSDADPVLIFNIKETQIKNEAKFSNLPHLMVQGFQMGLLQTSQNLLQSHFTDGES